MKKLLLLIACVAMFVGCEKEEIKKAAQTIMINAYYQYPDSPSLGEEIASPTVVQIYDYEQSKYFDQTKSVSSITDYGMLTDSKGMKIKSKYQSSTLSGINTFENIPNGKYILVVFFKPDGYTWPMFYYYGYKTITADGNNLAIASYKALFNWKQDSGKFIEIK